MMVNMSVWESIEALRAFVYTSGHTSVMRNRKRWFEKLETYLVLWWVPAGHEPTIEEAKERLEHSSAAARPSTRSRSGRASQRRTPIPTRRSSTRRTAARVSVRSVTSGDGEPVVAEHPE